MVLRRKADSEETIETGSIGRLDRLNEAVARMRGSRRQMDPDRLQLITGAVLIVGGLIAILIGWYGAANTGFPFEQTPYLISGGLFGLALVFLGGFVYFAYWVTRLVRESRTQADRAADLLDQIAATLNGGPLLNGGRSSRPAAASSSSKPQFVATRGGSFFHRPDCSVVEGKRGLRKVSAQTRGLEPCRICNPLQDD